MANTIEFWRADPAKGEALISSQRVHALRAVELAALHRPKGTVLVTLVNSGHSGHRLYEKILWRKPGYVSSTIAKGEMGLLNRIKAGI